MLSLPAPVRQRETGKCLLGGEACGLYPEVNGGVAQLVRAGES